ncbi:TM0106 family RecB-like putative nuclease [Micrococcus sp.]|uniref:TM0106 family RecB-like putative nuclease n=1 Tax=Micrococcus sp. TaxID=1271 RepID=UPI002A908869|nr:TM0106 family RecB-like putative nuclease [Micrococcus sp.]MDY6054958.1 TM0106 family RecB-like putative nuclease [Micrococcus sp.]
MVKILDDGATTLLSPSDITAAATCEYGWFRDRVDPALGRSPRRPDAEDAFSERVSGLGDTHEARVLEGLVAEHGAEQVAVLSRPAAWTPQGIAAAREATARALEARAAVVFQAMLHDGAFGGLADFLVWTADAEHPEGAYEVVDTKLARHARVTALLQIAAYADLLDGMGVPRARTGALWLGDHTRHEVDLTEVIPVYRRQRARLERRLHAHIEAGLPVDWQDPTLTICGACGACEDAIAAHRDVLLTAGSTRTQRVRLREAGITTIEQLAASTSSPEGMTERTWRGLRDQAAMQLGEPLPDGRPPFVVVDAEPIRRLPTPDPGDMFFDFEGDPLWTAPSGAMEGLEYLWGWVEAPSGDTTATAFGEFAFTGLWADSRAEERAALEEFVRVVEARRAAHPGMRIYHYAAYEVTALKRLTVRHGVGEAELDDWLRAGLFVDLYSTVRACLRAGVPSYSIKKLEPLYMGADHRSEDGVTTAADSVTEYHRYVEARSAGDEDEARRVRAGIEDYNRYDCVSTARLRDWLRGQAGAAAQTVAGQEPEHTVGAAEGSEGPGEAPGLDAAEASLEQELLALAGTGYADAELDDEHRGLAMLAAGLGYYQREDKPMWWAFFDRGVSPVDEWQNPRANVLFDRVDVAEDWHRPTPRARTQQRVLRVSGRLEPGTELTPEAEAMTVYEDVPAGRLECLQPNAVRWVGCKAVVEDVEDLPDGTSVLTIRERIALEAEPHGELPMAAFAHTVIQSAALEGRILQHGMAARAAGTLPTGAASDVLARRSPAAGGRPLAQISAEARAAGAEGAREGWEALVEALESARGSYVAVQGPPGTGKTHVGSHAVKALLDRGWSVGVTAQSHAVVENFLGKLSSLGVPPERIVKQGRRKQPQEDPRWTSVAGGAGAAASTGQPGLVVGGTAWAFAHQNANRFDLLVIDEAGQFSLAHTLAAAAMADTVLLLGDPQQLPQVSQGTHPQPVDQAALGWLVEGAPVLAPERGFFLDTTWRMHSALTAAVSELSYGGQLRAKEDVTDTRLLEGVAPGLHPVPVSHAGNAVSSPEEAAQVVRILREELGIGTPTARMWSGSAGSAPRPLTDEDVIVVAPYNAQVATVRKALDAAGFTGTTVGTVDKFQGREAPVAILTMAASSPQDVPRGLDFLLNRNRLNVSISRGKWAAYLVHSPALADALPTNPADLPMVGAFLRLVQPG